jgi:multiple sugar transport system ATP-binding protein
MATVSIRNVWKYYGKTVAVRDLNLEANDGEFLCVLGPSGCGKSSTLRMLAGLEHISSGEIYFGSKKVNELPPKDRDIAMVFENYALYPHKSVYENIANSLKLKKMQQSLVHQKVTRAAELLEIVDLLDRKPMELSGGQKQRVAIGRAIVREPQLFLFDEPIAHLDAKLRAHMRGELKLMQSDLGTTMVYVTHDQMEALSMADRVAVMHEGVLQQFGTPQEIYNNPVNAWVAGFVGEPPMNFLECELRKLQKNIEVVHPAFNLPITEDQKNIMELQKVPGKVQLAIRPDEISITLDEQNKGVEAKVLLTEPLGGDMLVDVLLDGDKILIKTKPNFQGQMGDTCYLNFDSSRWHLFDCDSGLSYF